MLYHLHMPSYILRTFTEYPSVKRKSFLSGEIIYIHWIFSVSYSFTSSKSIYSPSSLPNIFFLPDVVSLDWRCELLSLEDDELYWLFRELVLVEEDAFPVVIRRPIPNIVRITLEIKASPITRIIRMKKNRNPKIWNIVIVFIHKVTITVPRLLF